MEKEFSVSIKDFQIIQSASLTFKPGLNCIIGQSNNGKSAILKAVKSAIYNKPGTTSVRLGASSYAVGIQANGHTVIFQKGANSKYKVDNTVIEKIGRTQIDEVANALNIRDLNLNGVNEEINFLDQMEKPFLLDRSETDLFRFIVDTGKDVNITTALRTLSQDRQQITKDITTMDGRIKQVEETLELQKQNLQGSETKLETYNKVIDLGPRITRVKELTSLKSTLNDLTESIKSCSDTKGKLDSVLNIVEPMVERINSVSKKQEVINILVSGISKASKDKEELEKKNKTISKIDVSKLSDIYSKYEELDKISSSIKTINSDLGKYKNIKYPEFSTEFNSTVEKYKTISSILGSLKLTNMQLNESKSSLDTTISELTKAKEEVNSYGVCPMCGKPLHE